MEYTVIPCSPSLQRYVKHYWLLSVNEHDLLTPKPIMPYGWFELVFQRDMKTENISSSLSPNGFFTGQHDRSITINLSSPFRTAGISFQPWAGNLLFDIPANNFTNKRSQFSDLDKDSDLADTVFAASGHSEIKTLFDQYLAEKLVPRPIDEVSEFITRQILKAPSKNQLSRIIPQIGIGKRRIEQRFLSSTGVSISSYLRIARFDGALQMIGSFPDKSLTKIGLDAGYYDQAHFIRDFKAFSSFTPGLLRKTINGMDETTKKLMLN